MSKDILIRPKGVTQGKIWELYKYLITLEKPYVINKGYYEYCRQEKLCYISNVSVGVGEIKYGYDPSGWDLPSHYPEWVKFYMRTVVNGEKKNSVCEIEIDSLHDHRYHTIFELLKTKGIRIPINEEIEEYNFDEEGLPIGKKRRFY